MSKFTAFFNFTNLKDNLTEVLRRFPTPLLIIACLGLVFFIALHGNLDIKDSETALKIEFSLIVTLFLSLSISLYSESASFIKAKPLILQSLSVIFGILFYIGFKKDLSNTDNIIYFILTISGIISFLFFSPYLKKLFSKDEYKNMYYSYFYKTSVVFLISSILGGILFGLGSIGITAVFELFDLRGTLSNDIYGDWAIIALSIVTPIFALTKIPKKDSFEQSEFIENAFFSFLVKYIAIPFIYVYFIILYAYSIKVLANFGDWPKGEVTWLVIGFSVFGYLIYMYSYIFEETNKYIRIFRKGFPMVVIPQLLMLFYAIYLRISQYDITMNRYFVVVFGIWLSAISLYLAISKIKHIAFIPIILTIFTILISIGPWGVYSLPESRQYSRLEINLIKAKILVGTQIIPLKNFEDIDKDLSKEIYSGISYLCGYNNCEKIKTLFNKEYKELEAKHELDFKANIGSYKSEKSYSQLNEIGSYEIVTYITEKIKVKQYYSDIIDSEQESVYLSLDSNYKTFPLDLNGYSKITMLSEYYPLSKAGGDIVIDLKNKTIKIMENGAINDTIDISQVISKLTENYIKDKKTSLTKTEMTFDLKTSKNNYKLILENISIKNPSYKLTPVNFSNNISGYLLIK